MFVDRSRLLTQGAVLFSVCALSACAEPTLRTDLRPDGAPEVLSVLVMNDSSDLFLETATFCKMNDDKRPSLVGTPLGPVQICDADIANPAGFSTTDPSTMVTTFTASKVEDAVPTGWYVRIMFDELLDPNVEDLIMIKDPTTGGDTDTYEGHIDKTLPVTLTCGGVAVAYDGYYSPSGNNVTWPLGPSLFIAPLDTSVAATGGECSVTIKPDVVHDKTNVAVPMSDIGPYTFKIAPLEFVSSSPAEYDPTPPPPPAPPMPGGDTVAPEAPIILTFNAAIDATSLAASEVTMLQVATCADTVGTVRVPKIGPDSGDPTSLDITDSAAAAGLAFVPLKTYKITFSNPNEVQDVAGGKGSIPTDLTICFTTDVATP